MLTLALPIVHREMQTNKEMWDKIKKKHFSIAKIKLTLLLISKMSKITELIKKILIYDEEYCWSDDLQLHHTHDDIQLDSMTWSVILVLYNSSANVTYSCE